MFKANGSLPSASLSFNFSVLIIYVESGRSGIVIQFHRRFVFVYYLGSVLNFRAH